MAVELLKEDDFSICALGISGILESIEDFLQCDNLLALLIYGLPDHSVSTLSQLLEDLKLS